MLGRKKSKRKDRSAAATGELDSVAMPANPQQIVVGSGSAQQIQTLPPLPTQEEPGDKARSAVRVEELQRLMNQNPHLQSLYNGQVDMHQLSELELRRLEARFRSHMETGGGSSPQQAKAPQSINPPPKLSPSDLGPSLGAEGALAPQGLMSPRGLLMSYGFLGPQGLLRPRSDGARPGSLSPKQQAKPSAAQAQGGAKQSQAPASKPLGQQGPSPHSPDAQSSHFQPVQNGGSAFQTSRAHKSPFAEVLGKVITMIAGIFGLGPQGSHYLPGSGGSAGSGGPIISPGSSKKH